MGLVRASVLYRGVDTPLHSQIPSRTLIKSGRIILSDNWWALQNHFRHICLGKNNNKKARAVDPLFPKSRGWGSLPLPGTEAQVEPGHRFPERGGCQFTDFKSPGPHAHRSPRHSVPHIWHLSRRTKVTISSSVWLTGHLLVKCKVKLRHSVIRRL